jgi:hypothetical protein
MQSRPTVGVAVTPIGVPPALDGSGVTARRSGRWNAPVVLAGAPSHAHRGVRDMPVALRQENPATDETINASTSALVSPSEASRV